MPNKLTGALRYLFVSALITGAIVAGLDAVAAGHERLGVRTCGWEGNPCQLEPLVVIADTDAAAALIARR